MRLRGSLSLVVLCFFITVSTAQSNIVDMCPGTGIQVRPATFEPGGIILTSFDSASLWVYDIDRNTRYPLPDTRPCTSNCNLAPDAQWVIFLDPLTFAFSKMRLDGTLRTPLVQDASEVRWWTQDTLLVWTTDGKAYLRSETDPLTSRQDLFSEGIISIQPGGRYALRIEGEKGVFNRVLVNLDDPFQNTVMLGRDSTYFNVSAWSPDGHYLAYAGEGATNDNGVTGGEIFRISPGNGVIEQITSLSSSYGAVRINGYTPDDLSWSPDSRQIAFWVIELNGSDPAVDTSDAVLHVLDTNTLELRRYCAFSATEHTPETPRIIWSPDSSHLAFAGNIPGDDKGALLLAVNIASGEFIELSNGMFPVYGIPQLNAWGTVP